MTRGGGVQDADDFILDETQAFGAAPSVTIPEQHLLRHRAGRGHFGFQQLRHGGAKQILASGVFRSERVDRCGDPRAVETFVGLGSGYCHDAIHPYPDIGRRERCHGNIP